MRFVLVGGSATLLHYLIMAGLIYFAGATAGTASFIGYSLSTLYNYWANFRFTFGTGHSHRRSLPRFLVVAGSGLGINQIVLLLGISLQLPVPIAQIIATVFVLFWNYFINAVWTFARRELR